MTAHASSDPDTSIARVRRLATVPFWNREEGRVRAGWRVLVAVVLIVVAASAVALPFRESPLAIGATLTQALRLVLVLGVVAVWARYVDRRSIADYGFHLDREWALDFGVGLLVGTAVHLAAVLVFLAAGWAHVSGVLDPGGASLPAGPAIGLFALAYACVGVWEETVFRGLFIRNGAEGLGWLSPTGALVGAWAVSSAVFALLHFGQVTSVPAFLFWGLLGGGLLGLAYLLTGELGLPIGIHAAYNFAGNNLFGVTGVATDRAPTVLRLSFTGPDAYVGIPGLVNAATVCLGVVLALAWVRWRRGELRLDRGLATWEPR